MIHVTSSVFSGSRGQPWFDVGGDTKGVNTSRWGSLGASWLPKVGVVIISDLQVSQ